MRFTILSAGCFRYHGPPHWGATPARGWSGVSNALSNFRSGISAESAGKRLANPQRAGFEERKHIVEYLVADAEAADYNVEYYKAVRSKDPEHIMYVFSDKSYSDVYMAYALDAGKLDSASKFHYLGAYTTRRTMRGVREFPEAETGAHGKALVKRLVDQTKNSQRRTMVKPNYAIKPSADQALRRNNIIVPRRLIAALDLLRELSEYHDNRYIWKVVEGKQSGRCSGILELPLGSRVQDL